MNLPQEGHNHKRLRTLILRVRSVKTLSRKMKYVDLLGKQLKSDDVIDVLECDDLDVINAFDRLHGNQPDDYWVSSRAEGVQMRFNPHQST